MRVRYLAGGGPVHLKMPWKNRENGRAAPVSWRWLAVARARVAGIVGDRGEDAGNVIAGYIVEHREEVRQHLIRDEMLPCFRAHDRPGIGKVVAVAAEQADD